MIPHEKYDYIQVDNILQAAKGLIDELSYTSKGKTVIKPDLGYKYKQAKIIKAINILKHQMQPSHPHGTKEA